MNLPVSPIKSDAASPEARVATAPVNLMTPRWALALGVGIVGAIVIISRRPDAIFHAQFWAEDGRTFYADAYNFGGWQVLLIPKVGYFAAVPRLAALIVQSFPLIHAPLIFNLLAIFIQVLPVVFLFSTRFDEVVPRLPVRALLAFVYLALPNSYEITATITNAQWNLAVLAFMVIIATPRTEWWWRVFDVAVLLVGGLSGPFCILLLPVIAIRWWQSRNRWTAYLLLLDALTALAQVIAIVATIGTHRVHTALGASPSAFIRIVSGQIFLASSIGARGFRDIDRLGWWSRPWLPALIALLGTTIVLYVAWRAPRELRLFLLFAALVFAASLAAPTVSESLPQWLVMARPDAGTRYEYLPMLSWVSALVWLLCQRDRRWLRAVAGALLALMLLFAIPGDWRYPPLADQHFATYAAEFAHVPNGTRFTIPINPPGWTMTLVTHR